jgi:uncharacterized membrane protein YkoI
MKNILSMFLVLILLVPLSAVTHAADSQPSKQKQSLKVKSSSQAAKMVKSRTGGKVLKVQGNGKSGYKVKVMKKSGHIVSLKVDAKSGRIKGK